MPGSSAAQVGIPGLQQEAQRHRAQAWRAGNENDAFVIPAGLAFARSIKERPQLNLYAADKRHPSLAGTYLAASRIYGALFKKSPVGLKYLAGLDEATATFLQTVAWDTAKDYYRE